MRVFALLALLLGCRGPPPDPNCLTVFYSPPPYLVLGDPNEHVEIKLPSPITCPPEVSLTVEAGILAPDNASHPVESARIEGIYAVVTFTPDRPGTYHVTARIEPNVGVTQGDVIVPVDRRRELRLLPAELETCSHIDITPGGLAVCLDSSVSVYADGVLVQRFDAGAQAVMGEGVIWTSSGERWAEGVQRDGGRGFAREPESSLAHELRLLLGPTARDVVTVDATGWARRLRYSDGGISVDDVVKLTAEVLEMHSWWRGGDTILANVGVLLCAPLDAGMKLCGVSKEADVTVEPAGMWGIGLGRITLEGSDGGARLAVPQMQQKFDAQVRSRAWDHGLVVPFTVGDQIQEYAVSYRDGLVLERFTERGVGSVHSSTGAWVFVKQPMRAFRKGVAP